DTALVYYAGHGLQYQGQNYLVPTDAQLNDGFDVRYETIPVESVIAALDSAKGARILILDACRDLPLKDTGRRDSASGQGLATVVGRKGLIMAYATQANNVAFDGTGRNSFYAAALIKTMAEPGLEVGQVFQRVAMSVSVATGGRQLPEVTRSYPGEVYLNRDETDFQAWGRLRGSNQIAELQNFATKYASSFLRDDALARIKMLEGQVRPAAPSAVVDEARAREEKRLAEERNAAARLDEQRQRDKARREQERRDAEQAQLLAQRKEEERLAELRRAEEAWAAREAEARRFAAQAVQEAERQESARKEAARQEIARQESARQEAARQEMARLEQKHRDEENARIAAAAEAERREEMARLERVRREEDARIKLAMLEAPKIEDAKADASKTEIPAEAAKTVELIKPTESAKPAEGPA
ncbi:caspase family protein, partial [Methylobacterium frigidaeris]